jgi:PKD repeat protein
MRPDPNHVNRPTLRTARAANLAALVLLAAVPAAVPSSRVTAQCSNALTSTGDVPLSDLGEGLYAPGHAGGLYPGGRSSRPPAHELAGLEIARDLVVPRGSDGTVDLAGGRAGMISIGMSNTSQEFDSFLSRANADPARSPQLIIVNGAQGGVPAEDWVASDAPWDVLRGRVQSAGLSITQVQVLWMKHANRQPSRLGAFPAHARSLQSDLAAILRRARAEYPNLRLAFLSSRTRAYTDTTGGLNPEPFAYESGFSVRWVIEDQIEGRNALSHELGEAPWLAWGPYLWVDGETPRTDGLVWLAADLTGDCTHPSGSGRAKVADQLLAFFKSDPVSAPWFLRGTAPGGEPRVDVDPESASGPAPLSVRFRASAEAAEPGRTIAGYAWSFGDGTTSLAQEPVKVFPVPGNYPVALTVTDSAGASARRLLAVSVSEGSGPIAPTILGPPSPLPAATVGEAYSLRFLAGGTPPVVWTVAAGEPPGGLELAADGTYAGTPLGPGTFTFTVEAANGAGAAQALYEHTVEMASGSTITTGAVADAYVRAGAFAGANFGAQPQLAVSEGVPDQTARSFLRFDLRAVSMPCDRALLRLRAGSLSGGPLGVTVYAVADDAWSEAGITWENMPLRGLPLSTVSVTAAGAAYEFEVTAAVLDALGGDGLVSLCAAAAAGGGRAFFSSREVEGQGPLLELGCGGKGGGLFQRGDCNADGGFDISDAVAILLSLFAGGFQPGCGNACDSNDDEVLDVSDAVYKLGGLFTGGALPPPPFGACGPDPTAGALGCAGFSPCP